MMIRHVGGLLACVVTAAAALTACSGDDAAGPVASSSPAATVTVTTTARPSTVTTSEAVAVTPTPTVTEPATTFVTEGVECGPRGSPSVSADGTQGDCARRAGTDGAVWSRNAALAPNPALAEPGVVAGAPCAGYQTGAFAYDASGTQLVCSEYVWQVNTGQRPHTEWGDGQREWAECTQTKTVEECRRDRGRG